MTKLLSLDALQTTALYELYLATVVDGITTVSAASLAERVGHGATAGFISVAMAELERQSLVSYNPNTGAKNSAITAAGIRSVEKGLRDRSTPYSRARDAREIFVNQNAVTVQSASASDRVVSIGDNGGPALEIVGAAESLVRQLKTGNDLGDLSPEEAAAAAAEVYQIELYFASDYVRGDYIIPAAQKSLRWIADKAAGAAVGKAALGLLVLVAAFFGINL